MKYPQKWTMEVVLTWIINRLLKQACNIYRETEAMGSKWIEIGYGGPKPFQRLINIGEKSMKIGFLEISKTL